MNTTYRIRLATEIMGTKIITPDGENIGVIQNMMIDPVGGTITYVVLCYANFIGKINRYYAIPSRVLKSESESASILILDNSYEKLLDASGHIQEKWLLPFWPIDTQRMKEFYKENQKSSPNRKIFETFQTHESKIR